MGSNGFKINECDKYVLVKNTQKRYVLIYLYIDDMPITYNNDTII